MARFLAGVLVVLVLALCAIYAAGWMNFGATDDTATIEIKTGKMKEAAQDAGKRTEQLIEDTQRAIERAATESPAPQSPPSESPPSESTTPPAGER